MGFVPGRFVAMQLDVQPGPFGLQADPEQVGEQLVVSPPAAHFIQRQQEQPVPLDLL
jgi:hypothetical protein